MYTYENGQFSFMVAGQVKFTTPRVAIVFDAANGALLKHGCPAQTEAFYQAMREAFEQAGTPEMSQAAKDLTYMEGEIPVSELNLMLQVSDYAGRAAEKLMSWAKLVDTKLETHGSSPVRTPVLNELLKKCGLPA